MTTDELFAQLTDEQRKEIEKLCKQRGVSVNNWMDLFADQIKPYVYGGLISPTSEFVKFLHNVFK